MTDSVIGQLRRTYHENICNGILGYRKGAISCADCDSIVSCELAEGMAEAIALPLCNKVPVGQTAGSRFTKATCEMLQHAFSHLHRLRPGNWIFKADNSTIDQFDQYEHLAQLGTLMTTHKTLKSTLGNLSDYLIKPDILVARMPVSDEEINADEMVIDQSSSLADLTRLRLVNSKHPILHASVSCKWTIRSDRAQNVRTEALNLLRNRKGSSPRVIAVTMEPLPSRIASIALGTGDIDCTYHAALHELVEATNSSRHGDAAELLKILVEGRRLRDISDLPFDLAS